MVCTTKKRNAARAKGEEAIPDGTAAPDETDCNCFTPLVEYANSLM